MPAGGSITTSVDASDVQPPDVTVKLYVPAERFVIVVLVPVPVIDPGLIVHVPVAGSPFSTTLPVGDVHEEGWVIVPAVGAAGIPGGVSITTADDGTEVHPDAMVTVKL
jgi:hypothetical protein